MGLHTQMHTKSKISQMIVIIMKLFSSNSYIENEKELLGVVYMLTGLT